MSFVIPSQSRFPTANQNPSNSILDAFNKQAYLGNQFVVATPSVSISGTSEVAVVYLTNPSTSTVSQFLNLKKVSSLSTNSVIFRFYYGPTVSANGTAITPVNLRPANANTSKASAYYSPTASANGTYISLLTSINFASNYSVAMNIIDPGQSLLVTAQPSASSAVAVELVYYEL